MEKHFIIFRNNNKLKNQNIRGKQNRNPRFSNSQIDLLSSQIETLETKNHLPCFHVLDSTMADKGKAKARDGPSWWNPDIDPKYCFR